MSAVSHADGVRRGARPDPHIVELSKLMLAPRNWARRWLIGCSGRSTHTVTARSSQAMKYAQVARPT
jgi:hypothetical protein